jgi:NAD(P)-dependent dehydrogenase (short-subunit alcohol dehydrogenase family)
MIITSSVAGASVGGSSMAYSVTKAAQLHLMRCLASTQGPKVRVNAVLPGLLLTDWVTIPSIEGSHSDRSRGDCSPQRPSSPFKIGRL